MFYDFLYHNILTSCGFYFSCDHNKYLLRYLSHLGQHRSAESTLKRSADSDPDSGSDSDGAAEAAEADSDGEMAMLAVKNT